MHKHFISFCDFTQDATLYTLLCAFLFFLLLCLPVVLTSVSRSENQVKRAAELSTARIRQGETERLDDDWKEEGG